MRGKAILVLVMRFGMKARIEVMFWTGGEGTLYVMIILSFSVVNFAISGAFFVVTSSASSGVQKKESSEDGVGYGEVKDVVVFD